MFDDDDGPSGTNWGCLLSLAGSVFVWAVVIAVLVRVVP
jgi:hypothetical protein